MGQTDWTGWLEEADTPREASVVPLRPSTRIPAPTQPRPILVVGGCGGAGTTTTTLGLAAAMSARTSGVVAVDATAAGGDLALRGADKHLSPISLQAWLYGRGDGTPGDLEECLCRASSGVGILWRDAGPLRRRASFLEVGRTLADLVCTPVYDGGAPVSARQLRPLLTDPEVVLVLAIPARPDAVNRLRVTLEWLDDEFGDNDYPGGDDPSADGRDRGLVAETTIVVSHQLPGGEPEVAAHLRENLSGWVRTIAEIPYDPHLARGELVTYNYLQQPTRAAYTALLDGLLT